MRCAAEITDPANQVIKRHNRGIGYRKLHQPPAQFNTLVVWNSRRHVGRVNTIAWPLVAQGRFRYSWIPNGNWMLMRVTQVSVIGSKKFPEKYYTRGRTFTPGGRAKAPIPLESSGAFVGTYGNRSPRTTEVICLVDR